jgi:Tol biopolymer transport system component
MLGRSRRAWTTLALAVPFALGSCAGDAPEAGGPPESTAPTTPDTDVWVGALARASDGTLTLTDPSDVTNRPGYDNQPFFFPDGSGLWYTRIDEEGQADIWTFDPATGEVSAVTATAPESEYSATPLPDGSGFLAVRVEADSTQRLWRFDADGSHPAVVLPDLAPVGYFAWADDHTLVMFVLGRPSTLRIGDVDTGVVTEVARNVGRSIQRIPGGNSVSFVQRDEDGGATLRRLDPASGAIEDITEALAGGDFHAWTPDGGLLMADGSVLQEWTAETGWRPVADLTADGLTISRLAVSPNGRHLAFVATTNGG